MPLDLTSFNQPQTEAILHDKGPILVLAGAGSGKTRVITYRIASLIEDRGVPAHKILAVTFTNKAAKEMQERLVHLIGKRDFMPTVSTFHSFCARVLREDAEVIGYKRSFSILDDDDCKKILLDAMISCDIDTKREKPEFYKAFIDRCKNEGFLPSDAKYSDGDTDLRKKWFVYKLYQAGLKQVNGMDFGDLILLTLKMFQQHQDILEKYLHRFQYLLVDETQDTNRTQFELIRLLAGKEQNVCVVGDDDQSIYSWRGAEIRNILNLKETYPDIKIIRMEQNYRCTKTILEAANSVIANNQGRMGKVLFTDNNQGEPIRVVLVDNEKQEAYGIAHEIKRNVMGRGMKYSDHAILYRVNALSRSLEEAMLKAGIPYNIVGGMRFYDRSEIKDLLAFLRLVANPEDDMALRRIINVPARGVGKGALDRLAQFAVRHNMPMLAAAAVFHDPTKKKDKAGDDIHAFARMMEQLVELSKDMGLAQFVEQVLFRTGYYTFMDSDKSKEGQSRVENIQELVSVAADFEKSALEREAPADLASFLERVALISSMDTDHGQQNRVTLMTMHASKGLEFPVVFIAGAEEGIFPHSRAAESNTELEEERRLAYVAITRAKEHLHVSVTYERTIFGKTQRQEPSTFLGEIPAGCMDGYGASIDIDW